MRAVAAETPVAGADPGEVSRRFWRLTAPRGLAATFEVVIVWADVVLVTVLRGPAEAGIYAAASRFVTSGTLAMQAIRLAIGPVLAGSFGRGDVAEAERVHRFSTVGAILTTWPIYLTVALFAPAVLSLLGPGFGAAAAALSVLAVAMLAVVATGNANTVLNMAGRSAWAARNTGRAAGVMLVLDLVLVPRFGIVGAAVGWSAAMITDASLGISQIRRRLGVRSFGPVVIEAAVLVLLAFGVPALAVRLFAGASLPALLAGAAAGGACLLAAVVARRRVLGVERAVGALLPEALRRPDPGALRLSGSRALGWSPRPSPGPPRGTRQGRRATPTAGSRNRRWWSRTARRP
jgi:O-antigen/teichoic acid export membrane protein